MQRPDLRDISGNIREALESCDRDTLLDILTFVFKEYLVEGPPPLLVHQQERIGDLEGLSFPELITALQTRLDVPELGLFQVEGNQVSVRAGGVLTPLVLHGTRAQAPAARPLQPGVQVIETDIVQRPPARSSRPTVDEAVARGRHDLAGMARDMVDDQLRAESTAPRPTRGLSISGRTTGGAMMVGAPSSTTPDNRPGPTRPAAAQPAAAQSGEQKSDESATREPSEPGTGDDSASTRFSLLELD